MGGNEERAPFHTSTVVRVACTRGIISWMSATQNLWIANIGNGGLYGGLERTQEHEDLGDWIINFIFYSEARLISNTSGAERVPNNLGYCSR